MFAQGRTERQMLIDHRAEILLRTIYEVKQLIVRAFEDEEIEHNRIAKEVAEGDIEVEKNIQQSFANIYKYDDKDFMLELLNESILVMVDSYCESTLKYLDNNGKHQEIIKGKTKRKTKIENQLSRILATRNIDSAYILKEHWPSFSEFHRCRNTIIHDRERQTLKNIDADYIANNIECVRKLLRAVDAITAK